MATLNELIAKSLASKLRRLGYRVRLRGITCDIWWHKQYLCGVLFGPDSALMEDYNEEESTIEPEYEYANPNLFDLLVARVQQETPKD